MNGGTKYFFDAGSVAIMIATIASWLPSIAALLTVVWTGLRIYETKTVQKLLGKWKEP